VDHFERTWSMCISALAAIPEDAWWSGDDARIMPGRIGYHILLSAERYTWPGPGEEYVTKRQFNLNYMTSVVDQFPPRSELLGHLEQMRAKTIEWLRPHGEAGLLEDEPTFPWTGSCALGQALYFLRHLSYHAADLNAQLRSLKMATTKWL
jgi:hypothetical protein